MIHTYVSFRKLVPEAQLPALGTPDSVGYDLFTLETVSVPPRGLARLRTGIAYAAMPRLMVPEFAGFSIEAQVRARSSTFDRYGLIIPNAPGTIDPDYTGEFLIQVVNLRDVTVEIPAGSRIAQLVFSVVPSVAVRWGTREERPERDGFGSTGT